MNNVLMILTHDRLDCLRLNLEMLEKAGAYACFDKVVLLLNGVSRAHLRAVEEFMARHPHVAWDKLFGPGTRPEGLVGLQNECVRKYPDSVYVKTDEDVFVPAGWAQRLLQAHEENRQRDDLALVTPLIPNNGYGLHCLLTRFYPDLLEEHRRLFGRDPTPERQGFTWQSPAVAEWATRRFLRIDEANDRHRKRAADLGIPRYIPFSDPFSIGCICYDFRHWQKMGGVPPRDEPQWCDWIRENGQTSLLDTSQIVLHYSFFVQQDWLDRTSLLEDIRVANLPGTMPARTFTSYHLPRWSRLARQAPRVLQRRLGQLLPGRRA